MSNDRGPVLVTIEYRIDAADNAYDFGTAIHVLEHVEHERAFLTEITRVPADVVPWLLLLFGVVFMLVGIAFKFGAAPFHMWLPDTYHGAPTAITLFIGSAPKLAAFGMAYRLLEDGVGPLDAQWQDMVAWLAALSLVIGNLIALVQVNFKQCSA